MVPIRRLFALVIAISLLFLATCRTPDIMAAVQTGFVLDLDDSSFTYQESSFNNSQTSQDYDFTGDGDNVTYGVSIPGNSTVSKFEFNVTGKIVPIYNTTVNSATYGLLGISIGNVTGDGSKEIITGTNNQENVLRVLNGSNGSLIWSMTIGDNFNKVFDTAVGNVTAEPGNEIVAASEFNRVYVINATDSGGSVLWYHQASDDVTCVAIGDLEQDGLNEIAAGSGDSNVTLLYYNGSIRWYYSIAGVNDVTIANISSDPGNETIVGASGGVYVLNSTGDLVWNRNLGVEIKSVAVNNVTSDVGVEIAAGASDYNIYLLNSTGGTLWNYSTGGEVSSVMIEDVTADPGNEVIAGSNDQSVYTLNRQGGLIWEYQAQNLVRTVEAGELTVDSDKEVVAGSVDGNLYVFNFDYFPTDLMIDVGANGTVDKQLSGALRNTTLVTGLGGAVQYYIDNKCTTGMCQVPLFFNSSHSGELNISALDMEYSYNVSDIVTYSTLQDNWSRTSGIWVNESVGNISKNVSFLYNPVQNVLVSYIELPASADYCDFNGSRYDNDTVGSSNACDVPDFTIGTSSLPETFLFWDSTMDASVPVMGNESAFWYSNVTDSFLARKNLTIWNTSSDTIFSVYANTSVDDSSIRGMYFLNVTWEGLVCNITPPQGHADCNTSSPVYSDVSCGSQTFQVCRKADYFRWIQPYSNSSVEYVAGGSTNLPPEVSDPSVTSNSSYWGVYFNYSLGVNDTDGDNVNVTLYYRLEGGSWVNGGTTNMTGEGTVWINLTSDQSWIGVNSYKFSYWDLNSSGYPYHSLVNTSVSWGPLVRKRYTTINYVSGNDTAVNRSDSVELVVRVGDSDAGGFVGSGVGCMLWVTTDGSSYGQGLANTTDSSGYCRFWFTPNEGYSAGNQLWKAGVVSDSYYNDSNSTDYLVVNVKGRVNVTFLEPGEWGILYRNSSNVMEAKLVDEYGEDANQSGFNCSFYFDSNFLNYSYTDQYGHCNISYNLPCGYSLGNYIINVTIKDPQGYYGIANNSDWDNVMAYDYLNITVTGPAEYSILHRGESPWLNSSVDETCGLGAPSSQVNWSLKWKRYLNLTVYKTGGYEGRVFPVTVNSSYLNSHDIDIWDWTINYTRVLLDGQEVPSRVNAWNSSEKDSINWSQEYFGNHSELVFLANQSSWENLTYEIIYNQSDSQEDFGFLENSGFESGGLSPWHCFGLNQTSGEVSLEVCDAEYCACEIRQTGGNYSLYLAADDNKTGGSSPVQTARIYSGYPLGFDRIKVRYNVTGEFDAGSYIRVYAGDGMCELSTAVKNTWVEQTCYNTSFSSASWINISVLDVGYGGGGLVDASHAYFEYICVADSGGDCVSYHSGFRHNVSSVSESPIGGGENITWNIPITEPLGIRKLLANASGIYYVPERETHYLYVYGWSELVAGNISSNNCTYNDTEWTCMKNATLDIFCFVRDDNTSEWVEGYNMSFWGNGQYLGSNLTGPDGKALYHWVDSADTEDNHTIVCNITDSRDVFYNDTVNNSAGMFFLITIGNTTADLFLNLVPSTPAENLTRLLNRSYILYINVTNNGTTNSMYDVQVNVSSLHEGVYPGQVSCPPILPQQSCNRTSVVNVTYFATYGLKDIYVNVTWVNSDASPSNISGSVSIDVANSSMLNITEESLNYTIPKGGSFQAGSFTIQSFGNTNLSDIELNISGGDWRNITEWRTFSPSSPISFIAHKGEQVVDVYLDVLNNATEGTYTANITANATGFLCNPPGNCFDYLVFIVNVTSHDWTISTSYMNKTIGRDSFNGSIGAVQIINQKEEDWSFNVSVDSLNATSYITTEVTDFNLSSGGTYNLVIYHKSSQDYLPGIYTSNIVITNKEDAVPYSRNVTVDLEVINLSINILSPNETNQLTGIEEGDLINLTVNATLSGDPDVLEGNMTWSITVGGEGCGSVDSHYNNNTKLWSINCSAPGIPGNPIVNDLELTGTYEPQSAVLRVTSENSVVYLDVSPPVVNRIYVANSDVDSEGNLEYSAGRPRVIIRANLTDNTVPTLVRADVMYNGVNQSTHILWNITPCTAGSYCIWTFNFTDPLTVGDYKMLINASDADGNWNLTNSSLMGYFDIYNPINMNGSFADRDGNPLAVTIRLFKNNTRWKIHEFSTNSSGHYKRVVHERVYDMELAFSSQVVKFFGVDMNATSADQWGVADPDNVTNLTTIDVFTASSNDITRVNLPDGTGTKIMLVAVEKNMTRVNSSIFFRLNYSQALSEMDAGVRGSLTQQNFDIYRCPDWDIRTRTCPSEFSEEIAATVDDSRNWIRFTTTETSAYAVAEWDEDDGDGDGDGDDDGSSGGSSGGSSSGGSVSGGATTSLPFSVTTGIGNIRIHPGENKTYLFSVKNKMGSNITVSLEVQGLEDFIFPEKSLLELPYNTTETIDVLVSVPETMGTGTYTGSILVASGTRSQEIPVTMTVSIESKDLVSLDIDVLTPNVNPGGKLRFAVDIKNLGLPPGFNLSIIYMIKDSEKEVVVQQQEEELFLEEALVYTKTITLQDPALDIGQYYLEIWAYFGEGRSVNDIAVFNLAEPYWSSWEGRAILLVIALVGVGLIGYYLYGRYKLWKREKSRYIFPLDFRKLPQEGGDSFWIGKVAETERKAWFSPADLTTHLLIAGSTGAGKSVSASVFVEEALDKKIPVIVFDPTAQWTGFVKALQDDNIARYYDSFGMDPKAIRPFKGMIFEITDPQELLFNIKKGFDRYLNPGEITIFTMDKLKPGQYDEAVSMIIDALFSRSWEESTTLSMIVVFDEVHRLLEKYGGKGGYVALEKAAREFRKWGVGMIMCSQVLADFKEAIAGNVLTEIQLNTKSMTDIQKVQTKYGEEYSKKISRQGVGVGMLQNPKYNEGKPYFVHFRPTWHNPHKISNEDMELYKGFASRLEVVESRIEQMKKSGKDTFDIELELKLAKDKLKQGRFRMAQIYITSLEQNLKIKPGGGK